jgi:hypothetical protein
MSTSRTVLVPAERLARWFENFERRHGATGFTVEDGRFLAGAEDGETASVSLSLGREYDGPADVFALAEAVDVTQQWGILLVRRGGFAVARMHGRTVVASKVGQRHVQGRTKAGGQSQQRFARRRDNQARVAYEAAADHAHRILVGGATPQALVCGGDKTAVDAVLSDSRLHHLSDVRTEPWLPVPDPRRAVLDQAIVDATSASITLTRT